MHASVGPIIVLTLPTLSLLVAVLIVRLSASRSLSRTSTAFELRHRWIHAPLLLAPLLLLLASKHLNSLFYMLTYVAALTGAFATERLLRATATKLAVDILNPSTWQRLWDAHEAWRFEMRAGYVAAPEFIDDLTLAMLAEHETLSSFEHAATADEIPDRFRPIMRKHAWGFGLPTTHKLLREVLPNEVFRSRGPISSSLTPEEIYSELRSLRTVNRWLLMDRLQYFWTIRNLNLVARTIRRTLNPINQCVVIFLVAAGATAVFHAPGSKAEACARGLAIGSEVWLLIVGAGTSLLVVTLFRGTGAFTLSQPLTDTRYDPIWRRVVQLGIAVFFILFVAYSLPAPFLFLPHALTERRAINWTFGLYAGLSTAFCVLVFVNHIFGTHAMMTASKINALERVRRRIQAEGQARNEDLARHYQELRDLHEWPLTSNLVTQTLLGIVVPILVQFTLIFTAIHIPKG